MHEVEQYVIQQQEREGDHIKRLPISWIQSTLTSYSLEDLVDDHLWFDEWIEENYGKERRKQHELKAFLQSEYMSDVPQNLRLPPDTIFAIQYHHPSYWYIREGNSQALFAIGHERRNTSGETRVDWQTVRTVSPNELIIIPPEIVHAFVNIGETTLYTSVLTQFTREPYRLTLHDKLSISQLQNQRGTSRS